MDDDPRDLLAAELLDAVAELVVVVRERDPSGIRRALHTVLSLGEPRAALVVAAAMIPADQPVDPWWATGDGGARTVRDADVRRAALADAIGTVDDYVPGRGAA